MPQNTPADKSPKRLIGVGASAGGLEALTALISNLPAQFSDTLIVAQHLSPHGKSMLVELLAKQSKLPVEQATDGGALIAGHIYIVPPNVNVRVPNKNTITLEESDVEKRPIPSIDEFFFSLAKTWKENAVGIILSGTGSDGAEGIRALHREGGLTLVQDGFSAKYDGMPLAAVDTACVDVILSPEEMGKTLPTLIQEHIQERRVDLLSTPEWKECLKLLVAQTGSDFSLYKPSTLQRRLWRRVLQVRKTSLAEYLEYLKKTPGEVGILSQELLVSVTSFFRDAEVFTQLQEILQSLINAKKHGEELRIWVAGCATGEEPYSLGILISEILTKDHRTVPVKIFATDLDQDAIAEGRKGIYDADSLQSMPRSYIATYFNKLTDGRFELRKKIRDMVVFAKQDMIQNPPFVRMDLVTCRNVLIYFESELQKRVMDTFHFALNSQGYLCLGKSESVGNDSPLFTIVDKKLKIYKKNDVASKLQMNRFSTAKTELVPTLRRTQHVGPSMLERGLLRLMRDYGHSGVIVDKDLNVIQVLGDISDYASFSASQSDLRLISLLPKSVGIELPILVKRAMQEAGIHFTHWYESPRGSSQFRMAIRSMATENPDDVGGLLFLVSFESRKEDSPVAGASRVWNSEDIPSHVLEMEQELYATREHLQTVIEELGVANEELQSLNEELSSANEELQSTNEELETTNEELQAGNEELTTVNEELNMKTQMLRETNVSLENIQESIGAGLIVVDKEGKVVRYNRDALKIFSLGSGSIGKPLMQASSLYELPEFEKHIRESIREGKTSETTCEGPNAVYQMRCQPFYDENRKIVGATLVFIDETLINKTRKKLQRSESQMRAILESFTGPVSMKDQHGRYLMVNSTFLRFFHLTQDQVLGHTDQDIFENVMASNMRRADLEVMFRGDPLRQSEEVIDRQGQKKVLYTSRFPLYEGRHDTPYAIGMIAVDITAQTEMQNQLAESESRYKALIEDQAVFVCRMSPDGKLLYANNLFEVHFGEEGSSLEGSFFPKFLSSQDAGKVQGDLASLSTRQPILQSEYRVFRKSGMARWIRWILKGIFDASGQMLEIQAIGFDITDYRTQTDRLLEKEAIFSTILANTSDIAVILYRQDREFVPEYLNKIAEEILKSEGPLIGRPLSETRTADRVTRLYEMFEFALNTNESVTFEDHWFAGKKELYLLYTVVPLRSSVVSDGVDRVAVLCKDISAHKTIEHDLRIAKEAAEVANEAKSDFLASMSHELRTPLNVVLGMSTLLSETHLDEDQKEFVGSIDRSGKALLSLIEDILDISKIESGKIKLSAEAFDLKDLIKESVHMFESSAEAKGIKLSLKMDFYGDQMVVGDPGRLRQVIVNLVGNALKFTDHGQVSVSVRPGAYEFAGEKEYHFEVKDTGIGIKKQDHAKIFQKFSQVESGHSRRFGGSGLGLVISRQIAEMMKGKMGFESEEGKGGTFWFSVRLHTTAHSEIRAKQRRQQLMRVNVDEAQRMNVLAVDDNKESLNVIRLFIERLGHNVYTAGRGLEAIQVVKTNPIDLVLMDVQMPGLDGYETTRQIRKDPKIPSDLPIIALTANAMSGDSEKCLQAGMNDYLTKPIRIEVLKEMLSRWSLQIQGKDDHART